MKVIVREVIDNDWNAIYLNDELVAFGHGITIVDVCEQLQYLIDRNLESWSDMSGITSICGERYYIVGDYEYDFEEKFSDIPNNALLRKA